MKPPKVLPPAYFVLSIALIAAMHFWMPLYRFLEPPLSLGGVILMVVGIAVSARGSGQFRSAGTPVVPFEKSTALVTTGLYRFTRNPMYLGMVVALVGIAIAFGTVGALIPVLLFVAIIDILFIRREEVFLAGIFGASYSVYCATVRRWI